MDTGSRAVGVIPLAFKTQSFFGGIISTNPIGYGFNAHTVTPEEMTQAANHFIQQRGVLSD